MYVYTPCTCTHNRLPILLINLLFIMSFTSNGHSFFMIFIADPVDAWITGSIDTKTSSHHHTQHILLGTRSCPIHKVHVEDGLHTIFNPIPLLHYIDYQNQYHFCSLVWNSIVCFWIPVWSWVISFDWTAFGILSSTRLMLLLPRNTHFIVTPCVTQNR